MWDTRRAVGSDRTVAGTLVGASWLVFAGLTVVLGLAHLTGTVPSLRVQSLLYLLLMVGISLPHGGFEHVENLRGRGERFQVEYLLAYLALVGGSLSVFLVAPVAGLAVALSVTALKAGHGGVRVLESLTDTDHLRASLPRALAVVVRGGALVIVPYLLHPGVYYMVASYMVGVFEQGALADGLWLLDLDIRAVVGAVYAGAVLVHLAWGRVRTGGGHGWRVDAGETLLLVAFFAVVPPILAIGVYFPCWYASRQVARLSGAAAGGRALASVPAGAALSRFARRAALPWVGALLVLAGMAAIAPNPPVGAVTWMAFYSVFVSVIAVPHVVVGGWLDRKQGIWSVTRSSEV